MKLIVHAGTGTIIDADDGVFLIDTDVIHDEALGKLLEDGDESDVVAIAKNKGRRISGEEIEMTYRNCVAFTPAALRYEVKENDFVGKNIGEEAAKWVETASAHALDKVAELIMGDELLWEHYTNIVTEAITAVYKLDTEAKKS